MAIEVGSVVEGKVSGVTSFGVFVDLGEKNVGMVHISEAAKNYVKDLKDFVKVGQTVTVKVLAITPDGKISLSMRQAEEPGRRKAENTGKKYVADSFEFRPKQQNNLSFEDMMNNFKKSSDEKMNDLKKVIDAQKGRPRRPKQ